MSGFAHIAVVNCGACTGKPRRRDLARLSRSYRGQIAWHGFLRIKDERGYDLGPHQTMFCPIHGDLDIEYANNLADQIIAAWEESGRVQRVIVPPMSVTGEQ